jgi:prepilin-type N-terminal cleavage/methylation domain-containing protein
MKHFQPAKKRNQAGFSLLEMLIAVSLFIIVTGSIYTLLELGRSDRSRTSRRGDTQKNARIAMYLIGRDVMNAGLGFHKTGALVPDNFLPSRLGVPADPGTVRDTLTSVAGGNNVYTNKYLPTGQKTDSISFVYRDLDFNNGRPIVVSNEVGSTTASNTQVVLQLPTPTPTISPAPAQTPSFDAATNFANVNNNDLFIAETKTSQIMGIVTSKNSSNYRVTINNTDNLGINQARNLQSGGVYVGSLLRKCVNGTDTNCTTYTTGVGGGIVLKKIEMVSYSVTNDGTLVRTIYGNNTSGAANEQIQQRAIAYGVQDFQIRYQMIDGTIVDDPVVGVDGVRGTADDTPDNMNNVRFVSISLTVSSTEVDEKSGDAEIIVLNSIFSLRNLSYDDK